MGRLRLRHVDKIHVARRRVNFDGLQTKPTSADSSLGKIPLGRRSVILAWDRLVWLLLEESSKNSLYYKALWSDDFIFIIK